MNDVTRAYRLSMAICLAFSTNAFAGSSAYTDVEAIAGQQVYATHCARCHGETLRGAQFGPPLVGEIFTSHWQGKTIAQYTAKVSSTMPPGMIGSLEPALYTQVVAFVLKANGVAASSPAFTALPASTADHSTSMGSRSSATKPGSTEPIVATASPMAASASARLQTYSPVTDANLSSPSEADWLVWRRTYDSQGFSSLKQITASNVKDLRQVWSWSLAPGWMQGTPLVHDGVMFIQSGMDTIQALDAANGDLLWSYSRTAPPGAAVISAGLSTVKRNMALAGTTLYAATVDAHLIALDVRSGNLLWDQPIADYGQQWYVSSGPLVVRDKVITGIAGTVAKQPGGAAIVGMDAVTGKVVWRFDTVARPGARGGDTWNGLPLDKRSGGSVWVAGSFDPELNLAFFGTGNTYDVEPFRKKTSPRANVDLLYTNSTLALDPDTGKLVWYYQHMPSDLLDHDWAFERTLATIDYAGAKRRVVITGGKIALFDVLDAKTGRYLFSRDYGLQTVVTSIDAKTGAKTLSKATVPGASASVCPSALGARSWQSTSFDPAHGVLFAPLDEICTSDVLNLTARLIPANTDGKLGRLSALDVETGRIVWTHRERSIQTSALLATAGGVLFGSNIDRWFRAFDASTGTELWRTRLQDTANAFPITYVVDGRQFVAIAAGGAKTSMMLKASLLPEIRLPKAEAPVLWVFALPEGR